MTTTPWICMKLGGRMEHWAKKVSIQFGADPGIILSLFVTMERWDVFSNFLSAFPGNNSWILMKIKYLGD